MDEMMDFTIELEREADGRWIAEIPQLPGVMCYGASRNEAVARVKALAMAPSIRPDLAEPALLIRLFWHS